MEVLKKIEIGNLISSKVVASPTSTISKIVGLLRDHNIYEIFLEYDGKIGVVTTRDILKVSNITSEKATSLAFFVPKLYTNSTIGESARLMMDYRIRALPVLEDNKFIGVIHATSIINSIRRNIFSNIKAKNIMVSNPTTINRKHLTSKARRLMIRRKIDHLPVLDGNKLSGILISNHIVFNMLQATETIERSVIISEARKKLELPVMHIMDSTPLTCNLDDNLSLILDNMFEQKTTYSLITLWDELQGIITYRDYMKLIADQLQKSDVPIYIVGLPEDPFQAEIVKNKFMRTIEFLKKRFPFIEEANSVIKTFSKGRKERRRYEVNVSIVTPKKTFSYSERGWDLPKVFDAISEKLKNTLLQKRVKRK
ncbi:MAG: CBS domain-containing protein [Candidatus Bathyarchaeota archaeon]|nr:MAG: CBS domain-containing protein [Candidatus Bathyarchaeota archaeon]